MISFQALAPSWPLSKSRMDRLCCVALGEAVLHHTPTSCERSIVPQAPECKGTLLERMQRHIASSKGRSSTHKL